MQIQVNGENMALEDNLTVSKLIERMRLGGKRLAVEINGEIVPRSMHEQTRLSAQDRVEIVLAIGGG